MELFKGIRGRLGTWLEALKEEWGSLNSLNPSEIRPLLCVRTALGFFVLGSLSQVASARVGYVNSLATFSPSDTVVWDAMGREGTILFNPSVWKTKSGLRFKISKPNTGSMRLDSQSMDDGKVLCINTTNSTSIRIDFDQPVSAAAAQVVLSHPGYSNFTVRAFDARGAVVLQSAETLVPSGNAPVKYMGALANTDQIKAIDFSTDSGVIEIGRLDILSASASDLARHQTLNPNPQVPAVLDQTFYTVKNGGMVTNANVSMGAKNISRFVLVKAPAHASFFQLFSDGVFAYRPEPNFSGQDSFLFAGLGADGTTQSLPATATINVAWSNSAPAFKGGPDLTVTEDAGRQIMPGWASQITAGNLDEDRRQRLTWVVNTDQPLLFLEQPNLQPDGTLRFTPAPHANGTAHVSVWLKDDGGVTNGGADTSTPYQFTIAVQAVTHRPILTDLPDQTLREGEILNIRATASSVDLGKVVVYSLENAPQGMSIDPLSGVLTWAPRADQMPGIYDVTIKATLAGQETFCDRRALRINAVRHTSGPVLKPIGSQVVRLGEPVRFRVEADANGAPLQYLLGSSDGNATLDSKTGEFVWMPSSQDAGKNHTFLVSAFDPRTGTSSNVSVFTVAVQAPTLQANPSTILPPSTTSTSMAAMKIVGFTGESTSKKSRHSKKYTPKTHRPVRTRTLAAKHRKQARRHVK